MLAAGDEFVVRPPKASRVAGWVFFVCGAVFALTPLAAQNEPGFAWSGGVLMIIAGLFFSSVGLSLASARAVASLDGVRYRYGVVRRAIPASQIENVGTGPGSGAYYGRWCVHLRCGGRTRPIRLIGLQRPDTPGGRAAVEQSAAGMRAALGLDGLR